MVLSRAISLSIYILQVDVAFALLHEEVSVWCIDTSTSTDWDDLQSELNRNQHMNESRLFEGGISKRFQNIGFIFLLVQWGEGVYCNS